jgi:MraZ protein
MRFLGNIEAKIDMKGRAFLPSNFRKVLQASGGESLVLRKDPFQDCLVLYPEAVWNDQMDALRKRLNRYNAEHQRVFRQFVSEVEPIALDGNGRFLIPRRYLMIAGIQQNVKFIGMDDTIEIWAADRLGQSLMDSAEFGKILEGVMAGEPSLE